MCLIALAWKVHPSFPLMLVANRDEFHSRPTAPLGEWVDGLGVFGGRDLRAGGSWMALNAARRRLAAVTNVREPMRESTRSRGALVAEFVGGGDSAAAFAAQLRIDGNQYGPFNLLLWDGADLIYASNRPAPRWQLLPAGVYGLSNAGLDEPWPKVLRVTACLRGWLEELPVAAPPETLNTEPLFEALADESPVADRELPDTGVGIELERRLAPPFILGIDYGTRASSFVAIGADHHARFEERRFGPGGSDAGRTALTL